MRRIILHARISAARAARELENRPIPVSTGGFEGTKRTGDSGGGGIGRTGSGSSGGRTGAPAHRGSSVVEPESRVDLGGAIYTVHGVSARAFKEAVPATLANVRLKRREPLDHNFLTARLD